MDLLIYNTVSNLISSYFISFLILINNLIQKHYFVQLRRITPFLVYCSLQSQIIEMPPTVNIQLVDLLNAAWYFYWKRQEQAKFKDVLFSVCNAFTIHISRQICLQQYFFAFEYAFKNRLGTHQEFEEKGQGAHKSINGKYIPLMTAMVVTNSLYNNYIFIFVP